MKIPNAVQAPHFTASAWLKGGAVSLAILLAGCGGGGGGSTPAAVNSAASVPEAMQQPLSSGAFAITSDDYGLQNPTYLAATKSGSGVVLRAAVASSMTDPDFKTVTRIDIANPAALAVGHSYALGNAANGAPVFPGDVYFFNGHQSTMLKTVGGTISLDSVGTGPSDTISGSFTAVVVDGYDSATPKATYTIAGAFHLATDSFGPVVPAANPVPAVAASIYEANCASCHSLGTFDPSGAGAPDLALKGGKLELLFPANATGHKGVMLASSQIASLKVLLNVN